MSVSLENQIAENAEKYSRRYQQAGYLYKNLKNPLKHTMATAAHTGDIPLEWR